MGELREGRLRQGWGYEDDQDLRRVAKVWGPGFSNWKDLSSAQQETARHFPMLGLAPSDMQAGDIVLLPNLPDPGTFSLCEITGPYDFRMLKVESGQDYGHIRPAKLIDNCEGTPNDCQYVGEGLRRTLRCRSRLWRIDKLEKEVAKLVDAAKRGVRFLDRDGAEARFRQLLGEANALLHSVQSEARQRLRTRIKSETISTVARAENLRNF
jgi:hypothetical protein